MTIEITQVRETAGSPTEVRRTPVAAAPVGIVSDIRNVFVRELMPVLRNPASVLFAMVQPLVFLALFAPLLPDTGSGSALQWFVPGIVSMTALMSASFTGANLSEEIVSGSFERLLVSPVRRSALLIGKSLREMVPLVLQTLVIVLAVAPFAFDVHPVGIVGGIVVLVPFSVGLGALSLALAVAREGPGVGVLDRSADGRSSRSSCSPACCSPSTAPRDGCRPHPTSTRCATSSTPSAPSSRVTTRWTRSRPASPAPSSSVPSVSGSACVR